MGILRTVRFQEDVAPQPDPAFRVLQSANLCKVGGVEFTGQRTVCLQQLVARLRNPFQVVIVDSTVIVDDATNDAPRIACCQAA